MSNARKTSTSTPMPAELDFDVTQEIDPALADLLRPRSEPTLTPLDFDDIEVAIEPPRRSASHRR